MSFPHITEVRRIADERRQDYLRHKPLAQRLIEQKLPALLAVSDFGEIETEVEGIMYASPVNNKSICGISGRCEIEVDGMTFMIIMDGKGMVVFAQARQNGIVPKWRV